VGLESFEAPGSQLMIFKHCRELVKHQDAELYWAIRPVRKR